MVSTNIFSQYFQ